jgi:hypothetical protein
LGAEIMLERFETIIPATILIVLAGIGAYYLLLKEEPPAYREFQASWRNAIDTFIVSRAAVKLFLVGTLCVIALTSLRFRPWPDLSQMPFPYKLISGILGLIVALGVNFLFFGMWRYWYRFDDSPKAIKFASFALMLGGFFWGSTIYYFIFYLPQIRRRPTLVV